jgi:ribosomal protein L29
MKMDFENILGLSLEEIQKKIDKAERELLHIRMAIQIGQEKNTAQYSKKRKEIARFKTAICQKERSSLLS